MVQLDEFNNFKENFLVSKRYWLLYLIFITILGLSTVNKNNILHPKFEILIFLIVALLGIFCIVYYFMHNSDEELYKVALVIILIFGVICSLTVPILNHIDENEHFVRAEITSQGVIFPDWIGDEKGINRLYNHTSGEISDEVNPGVGFNTIESLRFFKQNKGSTIFQVDGLDTMKINQSVYLHGSAFEQNPFYGYLPQAIGIFFAKLLDLNVIWLLWLGRIFNLIFYAILVSLAVKKAPCLKLPLICVACIPVSIYHASSVSIDPMIFGLGLLTISYFMYLYSSEEESLGNRHIAIFSVICLLLGLCKLHYLAFIFLLLFIPKKNFKEYNLLLIFLGILFVGIIGVIWSRYSTPTLMHSWRSNLNYINSTQQIAFLKNNPLQILEFLKHTVTGGLSFIISQLFNFDYRNAESIARYTFISILLAAFLAIFLFAYPNDFKFDLKGKLGVFIIFLIIYYGTYFVQLLTWAYVGNMYVDVHMRYFIPLLALIPIFIQIKNNPFKRETFDKYAFVFIIGFMAVFILALATKYY